jgi:hypothetical protein
VIPASSENSPSRLLMNTWGRAVLMSAFAVSDAVKEEKNAGLVFIILAFTSAL